MKTIKLTQGKFALVDDEDFDYLNQWHWHYRKDGYAARCQKHDTHNILMHRSLMDFPVKPLEVDHLNGNKLDNQKNNLRIVSHAQNMLNIRSAFRHNTSGIRGVYWHERDKNWAAQIKVSGRSIHLGYFDDKETAIKTRQMAERQYFGYT